MPQMDQVGWEVSAEGWVASQGDEGDWLRKWVLDPVMLEQASGLSPVLDVGCGEGRFMRALSARGAQVVGVDPTETLLRFARERDPATRLVRGVAETLPFRSESFALVVSYVTLVDIVGYRVAVAEMARVLRPSGRLLVATISPFASTGQGWVRDSEGRRAYFPIDDYLQETEQLLEWKGIRIHNYHRPLSSLMDAFLDAGLVLSRYLEPAPIADCPAADAEAYVRVPYGTVMVWAKP